LVTGKNPLAPAMTVVVSVPAMVGLIRSELVKNPPRGTGSIENTTLVDELAQVPLLFVADTKVAPAPNNAVTTGFGRAVPEMFCTTIV